MDGELSDFVVYNTGLTSTAAKDYHHGIVPTSGLLLWGRMDETGYGSGLLDSSGNGNTGTAQGGATPLEDLVSVVITGEASNGSLFNHLDGNVTYTPDAGFTGTDSFTYKLRDNEYALSNEAEVSILATSNNMGNSFVSKSLLIIASYEAEVAGFSAQNSVTVYEDAEDGTTLGWSPYGDGQILNVREPDGRRVIMTEGLMTGQPFRLGREDKSDWNNQEQFVTSFEILLDQEAAVYFRVDTSDGEIYLCYFSGIDSIEISDNGICHSLGIQADGQWHSITRDLAADLEHAFPGVQMIAVKDFYVFGSLKLDNLKLIRQEQGRPKQLQ